MPGEVRMSNDGADALRIADGFQTIESTLEVVDTVLEGAMTLLKTTAFIGLVGGAAVEAYVANLQKAIRELSNKFKSHEEDLREAVRIFRAKEQGGNG
jgi:hypothetical protein